MTTTEIINLLKVNIREFSEVELDHIEFLAWSELQALRGDVNDGLTDQETEYLDDNGQDESEDRSL